MRTQWLLLLDDTGRENPLHGYCPVGSGDTTLLTSRTYYNFWKDVNKHTKEVLDGEYPMVSRRYFPVRKLQQLNLDNMIGYIMPAFTLLHADGGIVTVVTRSVPLAMSSRAIIGAGM